MNTMKKIILLMMVLALFVNMGAQSKKKYSVWMADSEMTRFPKAHQLDYGTRFVWGYTQGLGTLAILKTWNATGNQKYYDYVYQWADTMINAQGHILNLKPDEYNIDYINASKILFPLYKQSKEERFRLAMEVSMTQMKNHPRTSEGGFWHKKIYPHQMWLDGLYMASPFLAQYGMEYNAPEWNEEAVKQLLLVAKHTYDSKTGLYYHAWDESREQKWADPVTGKSPNFWGRSIGWYFMALVDVLDYVPDSNPQKKDVIAIIKGLTDAVIKYQDPKTGLWYQVLDQGGREGNYQEASVSSMFMYSIAKAVNNKYLPKKYKKTALKTYNGLIANLVKENEDGTISLTQCCAVAGLGGKPYRDGSYEYYINEKIRDNDAKATGPFIMGCLELGK
jgi:unsaturated rhamnogalacturonyl hydrolase